MLLADFDRAVAVGEVLREGGVAAQVALDIANPGLGVAGRGGTHLRRSSMRAVTGGEPGRRSARTRARHTATTITRPAPIPHSARNVIPVISASVTRGGGGGFARSG